MQVFCFSHVSCSRVLRTWKYIATFKRPAISTYIKGVYSFLENFNIKGYLDRKVYYSNFWVRTTTTGTWIQSTSFKFSVDGAGDNNQRGDYRGGVENGKFFCKTVCFLMISWQKILFLQDLLMVLPQI